MAYTTPRTWVTGELVTAAMLNEQVRDNQDAAFPLGVAAWTSWTPTLTNITVGSGTSVGAYQRVGRTIHYRWKFTYGAGSAVGTGPTFTLPVAPAAFYTANFPMHNAVHMLDSGTTVFRGTTEFSSGSTVTILAAGAGASVVDRVSITSSVPMTWATGDTIMITGTYEAAS